jgi:hypothetical protein
MPLRARGAEWLRSEGWSGAVSGQWKGDCASLAAGGNGNRSVATRWAAVGAVGRR